MPCPYESIFRAPRLGDLFEQPAHRGFQQSVSLLNRVKNTMEVFMESLPAAVLAAANNKSRKLRELVRAPEILVMPGAYDVLSALLFEQMGFKAIQGTSGGIAAGFGFSVGAGGERWLFFGL